MQLSDILKDPELLLKTPSEQLIAEGATSVVPNAEEADELAKAIAEAERLEAGNTGKDVSNVICFGRLLTETNIPLNTKVKVLVRAKSTGPKYINRVILYNGKLTEVGFATQISSKVPSPNTFASVILVDDGTQRVRVDVVS